MIARTNLFLIFTLIASTIAYNGTRIGTLYITELEAKEVDMDLLVVDGNLVAGVGFSRFEYKGGTLKLLGAERYLTVWENKDDLDELEDNRHLVISHYPQTGFFLKPEPGTDFQVRLAYLGVEKFQLCGDNRIAHMSQCKKPRQILINFEDM